MYSKFWPVGGVSGILHHYTETLVAFECTNAGATKPHSILFVGGLGDGLATTSYMSDIVTALEPTKWSIFTLTLSSAYQSWGLAHLDRDTDEIAQCIKYIKHYKDSKFGASGKVVLMGHSTGSQCTLHYLSKPNPHSSKSPFDRDLEHIERPPLDGAIMQAPVSDREALQWVLRHGFGGDTSVEDIRLAYDKMVHLAKEASKNESDFDTMLPLALTSCIYPSNTPLSARRFLSLVSPDSPESPSDDDVFSSDLGTDQLSETFGKIRSRGLLRTKLMVLISGRDQSVPDWVNKNNLLAMWEKATDDESSGSIWDSEHSAVIPGASHALSDDDQQEPRKFLVKKLLGYLQTLA